MEVEMGNKFKRNVTLFVFMFVMTSFVLLSQVRVKPDGRMIAKQKRPDLAVTGIRLVQGCKIEVTIKNIGNAGVPASYYNLPKPVVGIQMYKNGKAWGGMILSMFDPHGKLKTPGGTAVHIWFPNAKNLKLSPGNHTIKVIADNTSARTELKKDNNSFTARLHCMGYVLDSPPPLIGPNYYKLMFSYGTFVYNKQQQSVKIYLPGNVLATNPGKWESCRESTYKYQFKKTNWPTKWFMEVRTSERKVYFDYRNKFFCHHPAHGDINLNFNVMSHPNNPKIELKFNQPFLYFKPSANYARLSAKPSRLPQINKYLWFSDQDEWEVCKVSAGVYHIRHKLWSGFFWKVNLMLKKVWRVTGSTFCQTGGSETLLGGIVVKPVY